MRMKGTYLKNIEKKQFAKQDGKKVVIKMDKTR